MTEGSLALLAAELGNVDCGARPTRGEATLNGGLACYNVYRASDGRYLAVGALEPKFWMALNTALGRSATVAELVAPASDQQRMAGELAAIFATKPAAEWAEICARHDCCVELVVEPHELSAHPLHRARGVFFEIDGGDGIGPVQQVRTPVGAPALPVRPPPRLGQHTREVLEEYGVDAATIAALGS
jgi:crotonobetainyl-CoA:carnitine CoA-transferase CaiB-like acyl-CoA transferase